MKPNQHRTTTTEPPTQTPVLYRRPFLKTLGITSVTLAAIPTTVAAINDNSNRGRGRASLEGSPSLVAAVVFDGSKETFPGYSKDPDLAFFDPGMRFDTTTAEITPNGNVIHYFLQFGVDKPYTLTHEDDGQYTPRGAVVNFEVDESHELDLQPGKYRATVREVVQLYEKGGYFDWSVTRMDLFAHPGMHYAGSQLIIVWDEDGDGNENFDFRTSPPFKNKQPEFSDDTLDSEAYGAIDSVAMKLMAAGVSNPGSQ